MSRLLSIVLLLGVFACGHAAAQGGVIDDLRAHRFEAVERALQAADDAFQAHKISENDLLDAYKVFYQQQDVLSNDMAAWQRERPTSAIAHVANGTYRRKLGEIRRGGGAGAGVPGADQLYLHEQLTLARAEMDRALQLDPRSYLAMLNLMNVAQFESDGMLAERALRLADKAYPSNLLVRARYLVLMSPRWGGSMQAMDAFVAAIRKQGVPRDVVRLLEAVRCNELGFMDQSRGEMELALSDYRRGLELARGADPRFLSSYLPHALMRCATDAAGNIACH